MTPERWKRIEELYHEARARPPAERAAFLADACSDDQAMRRDVESLVANTESDDGFLAKAALATSVHTVTEFALTTLSGASLGGYRLGALIGAGGMGQVYHAHDSKLGRDVAIKILPPAFTSHLDRLARFEREARMLASLNHPNICGIYGIEESDSIRFLILELVEGTTLADTLAGVSRPHPNGGGLPLDDVLPIARQIAEALEVAHEKGIVHRDLKPANIKITPDGVVKVLDFGLAKAVGGESGWPDLSNAPAEHGERRNGAVIGTAAYMSPEQARGLPVDKRTDIWAFGCVMYEMLTGRVTFAGETVSDSIAKILEREPDWSALPAATPAAIRRILLRCLAKDPKQRLRDIGDVRIEIDAIDEVLPGTPDSTGPLPSTVRTHTNSRPRITRAAWIAGGLAALVGAIVILDRSQRGPYRPIPLSATFTRLTSQAGIEQHPSLSPDGKWIVYSAPAPGGQHIFLQSVGGQKAIDLTSEAVSSDTQPVFSPDGEQIAFRSERLGGGIFVMGRTGEFGRRVATAGFNPAWSPDGREILYSTEGVTTNPYNRIGIGDLWAVTVASGAVRQVHKSDAVQPSWSPHGHRIAFWRVHSGQRDLFTIPARGGDALAVTNDVAADFSPAWSPDGKYLLFSSDRGGSPNLWRVPIDETTGKVQGLPEALTTNSAWVADLTVSGDGRRVAYASMTTSSNIQQFDFDPISGSIRGPGRWVTTGSAFRRFLDVSPDGHRLVFGSGTMQEDLFVIDTDGSNMRQLTNDAALDRRPTWSPDGHRIAFDSTRGGRYQIWVVNGDGSNVRPLTNDPGSEFLYHAWSPAGDRMFTTSLLWNAMIFDPRLPWRDQQPVRLPRAPLERFSSTSWSPDGRRLVGWTGEGIATYDIESQVYEVLTRDRAILPQWLGSNRIVYPRGSSLMLLDLATKVPREILSTAPDIIRYIAVSSTTRQIFIARGAEEGDIWMAQIK